MSNRQMLVNYVAGEECRIAITENGQLEEFYQERASAESHVGNIYKGRVINVEPSIQAAFVDFGLERNGFLHISDLHPMYFPGDYREESEQVGKKTPRRDRPPIQRCLHRGKELLVQVLKEGIGTKGPTLTSYLSIPGRFLVMMPNMERLGVSRKVEDDDARRDMRRILDELKPPEGFGFIIRTAGIGRTKAEIKRDLSYLQRLWKTIDKRRKDKGLGELYTESDLVIRTIRDVFTTDIEQIIVDHPDAAKRARDFLRIINPRSGSNVVIYNEPVPLFHRFDIERQIEGINSRTVPLPSGGSLVIESTEALVAIDVNSGKSREHHDAETMAFKTNMEATDEICRQLRLRDLGGVIVNDLIDMRDLRKRRAVEQRFKENLKRDRARTRTLAISQFGILEMTRQRMRPSLRKSIYDECRYCQAEGHVKSAESVVLDVMRRLVLAMYRERVARVELTVSPDVAFQLLNRRRAQLVEIETRYNKRVMVRVNGDGGLDFVELLAYDIRNSLVEAEDLSKLPAPKLETLADIDAQLAEELAELEDDTELEAETETKAEAEADDRSEESPGEDAEPAREIEPARDAAEVVAEIEDDEESPDEDDRGSERSEARAPARPGEPSQPAAAPLDGDGLPRKRRRRRGGRRHRRGRDRGDAPAGAPLPPRGPVPQAPPMAHREPVIDRDQPPAAEPRPEPVMPQGKLDGEADDSTGPGNELEGGPEPTSQAGGPDEGQGKGRRRRRRRRRRGGGGGSSGGGPLDQPHDDVASPAGDAPPPAPIAAQEPPPAPAPAAPSEPDTPGSAATPPAGEAPRLPRNRHRRRRPINPRHLGGASRGYHNDTTGGGDE